MRIRRHKHDGFFGLIFFFGRNIALDIFIPLDGLGWFTTKDGDRVYIGQENH